MLLKQVRKTRKKKGCDSQKNASDPNEPGAPPASQYPGDKSFCPACGKNCLRPRDFYYHHKHEGPYHKVGKCAFCRQTFDTWDEHKEHLDRMHGGVVKLPCGQCGLNFFDSEKEKSGHRSLCKFFKADLFIYIFG